jgi:hypothetical protein
MATRGAWGMARASLTVDAGRGFETIIETVGVGRPSGDRARAHTVVVVQPAW